MSQVKIHLSPGCPSCFFTLSLPNSSLSSSHLGPVPRDWRSCLTAPSDMVHACSFQPERPGQRTSVPPAPPRHQHRIFSQEASVHVQQAAGVSLSGKPLSSIISLINDLLTCYMPCVALSPEGDRLWTTDKLQCRGTRLLGTR